MPEIVKAEPAIPISSNNACLHSSWSEVIGHQHIGNARLLSFQLERWKNPVFRLCVRRPLFPGLHELCKQRMHGNRSLRSLTLRETDLTPRPCATDTDEHFLEVDVLPDGCLRTTPSHAHFLTLSSAGFSTSPIVLFEQHESEQLPQPTSCAASAKQSRPTSGFSSWPSELVEPLQSERDRQLRSRLGRHSFCP